MSSSTPWSDRRGMFQPGKQVHEPGKISGSSVVDAVRRASVSSSSGDTKPDPETVTPGSGRRRSSGVPFENLSNLKRGSQDYGERRASHSEMQGPSSFVSGWFNKTFRGMTGSATSTSSTEQAQKEPRRGVMEWMEQRTDSV